MKTTESLNPCPCCGSHVKIEGDNGSFWIECTGPQCWMKYGYWPGVLHDMVSDGGAFKSENECRRAWGTVAFNQKEMRFIQRLRECIEGEYDTFVYGGIKRDDLVGVISQTSGCLGDAADLHVIVERILSRLEAPEIPVESAAKSIRAKLLKLTDEQRLEVMRELDFCTHCGTDTSGGGCCCWNDE